MISPIAQAASQQTTLRIPGWVYGIFLLLVVFLIIGLLLPHFIDINIFTITPWLFPVLILTGVLIFLGYYLGDRNPRIASIFLNLSVLIVFFSTLALEMTIFGIYFTKMTSIPYEKCEKEEAPVHILSCIMTGHKVASEFGKWEWASFWLFFIILPFAFVFSLLYGLIAPVQLFPKPAMLVIIFVLSAYAVRQIFGAFLLDLAAYGIWGVVGIFIPLFLSFLLKRVFDTFLGPLQNIQQEIYGRLGAYYYASCTEIRRELEQMREALKSEILGSEVLQGMLTRLQNLDNRLAALENGLKSVGEFSALLKRQLEAQIRGLRTEIRQVLKEVQTRRKQRSGK